MNMPQLSFRLRNHGIVVKVSSASALTPGDAITTATRLSKEGIEFDKALVDRDDGLVLIGSKGNWHFWPPLNGTEDERTRAAAWVLFLSNFGSVRDMVAQVNHGNTTGKAVLYR